MRYVIATTLTLFCLIISACSEKDANSSGNTSAKVSPGEALVKKNCKVCHAQGINGAPIIGNAKMWGPRITKGVDELANNAANGFGLMPAKGGNTELTDAEIRLAVEYMVAQVK